MLSEDNNHPLSFQNKEKFNKLLDILFNDPFAYDFLTPVDFVSLNILDYPTIVKHPMDLGTVKEKLNSDKYKSVDEVINDINLVWENCHLYNKPSSNIYKLATHCEKVFKKNLDKYFKGKALLSKSQPNEEEKETNAISISDKINIAKRIRTISNENLSNLIKYIMKENPILIEDVDSDNIQLKLDMLSKKTYNEILEIMNTPIKESKK